MSIECTSTSPFASRFDSSALTPSSAIFTGLTDFSTLIDQENPLDKVNRDSVVSITNKLNAVLGQEDLTAFPTLKNKYEQFPLTFVEIADYVLKNSVDVDILLESLNTYSPTIGMNSSLASLASDLNFFYEENLGASISGGQCAAFGELLTGLSLIFDMIDTGQKLLADIKSLDLDPVKLASTIAGKLQLSALLAKVEAIIEQLIEKVKLEILKAINSIIPQLKAMGCASKALFKKLNREISEVKSHFSDANMESFKDRVKEFFTNITVQFERTSIENLALLMYRLCQFTELLQDLLMGPSKDLLRAAEAIAVEAKVLGIVSKRNIKKAVDNGATRIDPAIVKKTREDVIKTYSTDLTDEHLTDPCPTAEEIEIIASITNKGLTDKILFASRDSSSLTTTITSAREDAISTLTSATSAPESIPGIPESVNTSQLIERVDADTGIITLEETEIYDKSTNSSSLISKTLDTASSVTSTAISAASDAASNVKDSLSFDSSTFSDPLLAEWSNVDVSIWAKLLRVQKQTGNTYTVLHGVKEKTSTTADMGGRSNHIHLTPYAIDISVTAKNRERTVKAASKSGFTGIGIYNTYIHIDTGARRSWVAGQDGIDIKTSEQFSGEELVKYERLATMHDCDDHRKARIIPLQEAVIAQDLSYTGVVNAVVDEPVTDTVDKIKKRSYNAL